VICLAAWRCSAYSCLCRLQQLLQPVKSIQMEFGSMRALTEKVHLLELRSERLRILSCTAGHRGAFSADV
jgi:hypothetical protein